MTGLFHKIVRPVAQATRSKTAAYGEEPPRRAAGTVPPASFEALPAGGRMNRPTLFENPHVCPEDGYCAFVRCPNATPGFLLIRYDPRNGNTTAFRRVMRAERIGESNAYGVTFAWEPDPQHSRP